MLTKGTALNTAAAASCGGGNGDPLMNMLTVFGGDCDRVEASRGLTEIVLSGFPDES